MVVTPLTSFLEMGAYLQAVAGHLPDKVLGNEELAALFPEWTADKILEKTGIAERRVAAEAETAGDLAFAAAEKLFAKSGCPRESVDAVILCTQAPDHILPTTACLLQHRLGLKTDCLAFDVNLGCSGYVYGLAIARGLLLAGQATRVLLLTADTYSKYIHPLDKSVRTLFGDAAAASLLTAEPLPEGLREPLGWEMKSPAHLASDGSGGRNLIVPNGGFRAAFDESAETTTDATGSRTANHLFMNGPEIFNFTLRIVPDVISKALAKASMGMEEIDLVVMHQANRYMLEHLRKKLKLPAEKAPVCMEHCGNTVSSTIPLALESLEANPARTMLLVGFGVGYSWGALVLTRGDRPA
jgi:3-oxoacyl-[acyl-carrier-protein] synthase III